MVSSDLPGYKGEAKWHIRKRILQGGKQEGVEIIEVDNGKLRFCVIPTRGMGILDVNLGDVRLGWDSPIKEVVHPKFINLESRGGLGWIEGFNEWLDEESAPARSLVSVKELPGGADVEIERIAFQ